MRREKDTSYIDELTQVYNRRYLNETVRAEIKAYIEKKVQFSIAWVDIDHFKPINDSYGHLKGDEVIKEFANFLKQSLRFADTIVRYGGDEFVCVLPKTNKQDAEFTWNRIIKSCRETKIGGVSITMSVGLSSYPDDSDEFDELLSSADDVLYDAKRSGRDRLGSLRKKRLEIPMKSFINRCDEKEKLRTVLSERKAGIKIAIIKGSVGIGKTRLAKELLSDFRGIEIIWSDCIALADSIAYYPIREIIKYRLQRQGIELLEHIPSVYKLEISKLVPEILSEVDAKSESTEQVVDKYRLYESVKLLIDCGERDKVIIIDNIQWIDPDSIEVLKYVFRSLKDTSLKCLLVHRTEEETSGLQELAAFITREFDAREIALINFPEREIKECVKAICGEVPSEELLRFITEESGGNPFYIEQIMRELVDQNYLNLVEDTWCFKKPVTGLVPKGVADITMMKYQRLSDEGKKVLEMATLLGKFDPDLIQRMTGYNTGHIIGLIGDIENLGLVKEVGPNIEFQDALSRNAIYEQCVTGIKRRTLHQEVARVLEERYKDNEKEVLEELAFHYYRAKNAEKGIPICLKVGDRAKELYSNHNAIKYYKWAEELLEGADDPASRKKLVDCRLKQIKVLGLVGDLHEAMELVQDTKHIAQDMQDPCLQAELQYLQSHIDYQFGDYEKAVSDGEESMRFYRTINDDLGVAKVLLTVGGARRRLGDYARALRNFEEAQRIAKQYDDQVIELRAHGNIGNVYINMGEYSSAFARYEQAVKIAENLQDQVMIAQVLTNMGNIYYKQGIYEEAKWLYLKSLDMSRKTGNKTSATNTMNNLGSVYHSLGLYDQALQTFHEALHVSQATGSKQNESILLNNIGTIQKCMGEYECAKKYYEDSMQMSEQIKSTERIFSNFICLGELYLEQGETAKTKLMMERASDIGQSSRDMLVDVYMLSCKYYLSIGDLMKFTETLALVEDIQKETQSESLKAAIDVLYGRCYTQTGAHDRAAEHLQKALEIYKKLKHKLSTGLVYYYLGSMEIVAGQLGFARKDFERAGELFRSIGAKAWEQRTAKALDKLQ